MLIYNTLSGKKEILKKPLRRPIRLFVCGPTVYNEIHLGNFRTYLSFDLIVRYLRDRGFEIFYLQNITDIDDKIINRAHEEGKNWEHIARQYEELYHKLEKELNIISVSKYARATDYIPQIIKQIKTLIKKNHAYRIENDGWYFDVTTFANYGDLARRTIEQAEDGVSRIDANEKKRNVADFCLWKFSPPAGGSGEPSWSTDLGNGKPGWHIEDTAITEYFFGPQYDLHGGGLDLKFPHHEAEIAQQESASGKKPFVKIWMHAGLLTVNGQKMSKSLNNFITISEFLKHYSPDIFRMLVFMHHYRAPMDYSPESALAAQKNLTTIGSFLKKLDLPNNAGVKKDDSKSAISEFNDCFDEAMEDDFNTPKALAAIFDLINALYPKIWELSAPQRSAITKALRDKLDALGFSQLIPEIPAEVAQLVQRRELSRRNKQFTQSDNLRKKIEGLGYVIEDTPAGPLVLPDETYRNK